MKVLFAVSNDKISEQIAKKYQQDYKEIISSKNVYYFNAIINELQKDKSYDRIVISEDLEMFSNDNYLEIDKFIFEKLDNISDEAVSNSGTDIPIILICTDRRNKMDPLMLKIFGIGIYSALLGSDRSIQKVSDLIYKPRSKKEAKSYYRVESSEIEYKAEKDTSGVSETEIRNILMHFRKIDNNPTKCTESFKRIVAQYTEEQVRLIIPFLTADTKKVLEQNSTEYLRIIGKEPSEIVREDSINSDKKNYYEKEIKTKKRLSNPVIIPTQINVNNAKTVDDVVKVDNTTKRQVEQKKEAERIRKEQELKAKQERLRMEKIRKREEERIAAKKAEEERLRKEAEKKAEEERLRKEAERKAEEERLRKEAERKAKEERLRKEAERKAEEERLRKEAERKAEEERLRKEAERKAEEERLRKEAEKKAEEERLRKEAEKKAEEERLRKEAERKAEEERLRKQLEEQIAETEKLRMALLKQEQETEKFKKQAEKRAQEEIEKAAKNTGVKEQEKIAAKKAEEDKVEEEIKEVKRRGRPRKNAVDNEVKIQSDTQTTKRKRGRPRKEDSKQNDIKEQNNVVLEEKSNVELQPENKEISTVEFEEETLNEVNVLGNLETYEDEIEKEDDENSLIDLDEEEIFEDDIDLDEIEDDDDFSLIDLDEEEETFDDDADLDETEDDDDFSLIDLDEEEETFDDDADLDETEDDFSLIDLDEEEETFEDDADLDETEDDDDFSLIDLDEEEETFEDDADLDETEEDDDFSLIDLDDEEETFEEDADLDETEEDDFSLIDLDEEEETFEEDADLDETEEDDFSLIDLDEEEETFEEDADLDETEEDDFSLIDLDEEEETFEEDADLDETEEDDFSLIDLDEEEETFEEDAELDETEDDDNFSLVDLGEETDTFEEDIDLEEDIDEMLPIFDAEEDENYDDLNDDNDDMVGAILNKEVEEIKNPNYKSLNVSDENEIETIKNSTENRITAFTKDLKIDSLITGDKKIVSFVGTTKNGTSFIVNNLAKMLSEKGIKTAILDLTQNRNAYYIYTENEEELRKRAYASIENLRKGIAEGIEVNKNLHVYTSLPGEVQQLEDVNSILETLLNNYSLILLDCDFDTEPIYFKASQEMYLVQTFDVLTIQPLTAFLRDLKLKNMLEPEKLKVVINKNIKINGVGEKVLIGGMSVYNDPGMTYMTELFNKDKIKYATIPFEEQTYSNYLESLIKCKISYKGSSKKFISSLNTLGNMVYPLISGKKEKKKIKRLNEPTMFSDEINKTLDNMKKNR